MKRIYTSIPLIIIGVLILKTRIDIGEGCTGMHDGLLFLALGFVYVIFLLVLLIISIIGFISKKRRFNFYPLVITLALFIGIVIAYSIKEKGIHTRAGTTSIAPRGSGAASLVLKDKDKFIIKKREVEWTCVYKGRYDINGDTLTLLRDDIQTLTDSAFSNVYIIDTSNNKMYYVDMTSRLIDSARSLEYLSMSLQ